MCVCAGVRGVCVCVGFFYLFNTQNMTVNVCDDSLDIYAQLS